MASVFKRSEDKGKKGSKWVASWLDAEIDGWRHTIGYTDREQTLRMAQRLESESAAKREGFTSSVREESIRPIEEQLREFLTDRISGGAETPYVSQLESRIRRVIGDMNAKRLIDISAAKYQDAVLAMRTTRGFESEGKPLSVTTRNEYLNSMKCFTGWAKVNRKLEHDPLEPLSKSEVKKVDRVHPRRALTVDEVVALLAAAARRPEIELLTIRTGKRKGEQGAKVRPALLEAARQTGIDRRMAYLLAIWSGLRRNELELLEWRDVVLDVEMPFLMLREEVTKNDKDDTIALHQQAAAELLAYRPATFKPRDRVCRTVPAMKVMKADLLLADIDYGTEDGFADLHAQRKTLNMMLAAYATPRARQAQLRHADSKLTEGTYFDKVRFVKPLAEEMNKAPAIPTKAPSITGQKVIAPDPSAAQLVHNGGVSEGHFETFGDTAGDRMSEGFPLGIDPQNVQNSPDFGTQRHDPASRDTGSSEKRVIGVEPTTFTLATCRNPVFTLKTVLRCPKSRP